MRIELTINTNYLPEWGTFEGIRELIQNAKDAETQYENKFSVKHSKSTNILTIENKGNILSYDCLLLGHSSKSSRSDLIGKFGEGLKLGMLALVREGHHITISTGNEVWTPVIEPSNQFNSEVLCIHISKRKKFSNNVKIEISDVDWEKYKDNFLFLKPNYKDTVTEECIFYDDAYRGKIFVKGIFVTQEDDLYYGYNFTNDISLDRDRKMLDGWSRDYNCFRLIGTLSEDVLKSKTLSKTLYKVFEEDTGDVRGFPKFIDNYVYSCKPLVKKLVNTFKKKHGTNSVPVPNKEEAKYLEFLGTTGIVSPNALCRVFYTQEGNLKDIQKRLDEETIKTYKLKDLDGIENSNIHTALNILKHALKDLKNTKNTTLYLNDSVSITDFRPPTNSVSIVDFRSPTMQGQYKEGAILISKECLGSLRDTLTVLVHEYAHNYGIDGEKKHTNTIELLWSIICTDLLGIISNMSEELRS